MRSLAQSGEASTAGANQGAHGAYSSLPAAAQTAQASPAAVGSGLLGGSSAPLSGDRNPKWALRGAWRSMAHGAHAEEPMALAQLTGKASTSSLK